MARIVGDAAEFRQRFAACGGEFEGEGVEVFGDAQQADEAVAVAAAPAGDAGGGGFEGIVDVAGAFQRLNHALDGGVAEDGFFRGGAGGFGEFDRHRDGFVGLHFEPLAVAGGEFDVAAVAGDDDFAFTQDVAGLERAHFAIGVAGKGLAGDGDDGGDGLGGGHLNSPFTDARCADLH